ncbi:MAG: ArsR/SmtB family transcription factor, partial [Stellaceae bacterium]
MLEGIMAVAALGIQRDRPSARLDAGLRTARTCYDHFAGKLGVALADALRARGHLLLFDEGGAVTDDGAAFLGEFGIDLGAAQQRRRAFCRPCLDWTERRLHLGGAVGAALATRCFSLGWFARQRDSRALTITPAGRQGLDDVFGISL